MRVRIVIPLYRPTSLVVCEMLTVFLTVDEDEE